MKASECFLNAILLYPKNEHLWFALHHMFEGAERSDLLIKLEYKSVEVFKDDFENLIDPENLPKPSSMS